MEYDFSRFDVGQGIIITTLTEKGPRNNFRLIVGVNDDGIDTVPVKRLTNDKRNIMCDMSKLKEHEHNVPLRDAPPPFTYPDKKSRVYVVANISESDFVPFSRFEKYNVRTSDDYKYISDYDLDRVFDHDSTQKDDKELTRRLADIECEFPWMNCTGREGMEGTDFEF
jgi:hypothetical protein